MKIERADGLAWRTIDQETFIVDLRKKWMYGLNTPAGIVWQAIVEDKAIDIVAGRLALEEHSSWPADVVEKAIEAFLFELAELDLITCSPELSAPENRIYPEGYEAPALTWHEELRAFAQSCTLDPFNCIDQVPSN